MNWVICFVILAKCLMICAQDVGFQLNVNGINSITWNGYTFWSGASQNYPSALDWKCSDGSSSAWDTLSRTLDQDSLGLSLGYHYGTTKFRYTPTANKLKIDVTVTNTKNCDITYMDIIPFKLNLPSAADNWYSSNSFIVCDNMMEPATCTLSGSWGAVVMANDDPLYPLGTAFPVTDNAPANTSFQGHIYTSYPNWFPNSLERVNRKVPANSAVTFSIVLYFGSSSTHPYNLAWDSVSKWVAQRPFIINWTDRRAIAMDVLSTAESQYHSNTNPRGWFADKYLDITTSSGLQDFRSRLLSRADVIISNCQVMNCQGALIWDIEGQEFPHAISYIGDPSLMPKFAPEMDLYADEYIGKLQDAGLNIGFTIRPQTVWYSPSTPPITQADQIYASNNSEALQILKNKAAYAINRWGASMFYVDTNTNTNGGTMDPQVFRDLQLTYPNVLFLPEWESSGYYGVGAPYADLNMGDTGTPADARILYPNSFEMIKINGADPSGHMDVLQQSVLAGDVLLVSGWVPNTSDVLAVAEIYSVVSPSPSPTRSPSQNPTASPSSQSQSDSLSNGHSTIPCFALILTGIMMNRFFL